MDCGIHQGGRSIGLQDASVPIAHGFTKPHFHVDPVKEGAAVEPATAVCEELLDLAEGKP